MSLPHPLRDYAKRHAPAGLRRMIGKIRSAMAGIPIDDAVLAEYAFAPDGSTTPRLNLVLPNLSRGEAFGGILTGIDLFLQLARMLETQLPGVELRIILTDPDRQTDTGFVVDAAAKAGIAPNRLSFLPLGRSGHSLPTRKGDIFIAYNWWAAHNIRPIITEQAAHFGRPFKPLIYLVQDYEPHMLAFSSAQILAREAYDRPERLWGIFNSSNLYNYFTLQGHSAEKSFTFEPVINAALRPALAQVGTSAQAPRIIAYGRPSIPRNCYPALIRGLRRWAVDYPEYGDWEVVTAGLTHAPLRIDATRQLTALGKLSLEDYAATLLSSRVGISLMASPHPSYPPLEMAHLGLRTVTNRYLCKQWEGHHPNIVLTPSLDEHDLARAIADACAASASPVCAAPDAVFTRAEPYPFLPQLCADLVQELA